MITKKEIERDIKRAAGMFRVVNEALSKVGLAMPDCYLCGQLLGAWNEVRIQEDEGEWAHYEYVCDDCKRGMCEIK